MPTSRNPFRPGASLRPVYLAGRDELLARMRRTLAGAPEIPANMRLTGLRGVGKSVLLQQFEELAQGDGWTTWRHELEPRSNTEPDLSRLIGAASEQVIQRLSVTARVRAAARVAARAASSWTLTYDDLTLRVDPLTAVEAASVTRPLHAATIAAARAGTRGLLVLLDEAQVLRDERGRSGEHPLSMLLAAVNGLQSAGAPLALVVCGLPALTANLVGARTYSERMFRGEVVEALGRPVAREALLQPLSGTGRRATEGCVERVLGSVDGYPYFIQLWGAELWDAAVEAETLELSEALLRAVEPRIYERLDRDFYGSRLAALRPAERELVLAGASCPYPPLRVADLRSVTPKSERNVNVLVGRLAEGGLLDRTEKGVYRYTAPGFHEFLVREAQR
jgi:hypothetical protein